MQLLALLKKKADEIQLKAMGQAISKSVQVAEIIKRRIPGIHQDTIIESAEIKKRWIPKEEGLDVRETSKQVSSLTIRLSLKPLDTTSVGYQKPLPESEIRDGPERRGPNRGNNRGNNRQGGRNQGRRDNRDRYEGGGGRNQGRRDNDRRDNDYDYYDDDRRERRGDGRRGGNYNNNDDDRRDMRRNRRRSDSDDENRRRRGSSRDNDNRSGGSGSGNRSGGGGNQNRSGGQQQPRRRGNRFMY